MRFAFVLFAVLCPATSCVAQQAGPLYYDKVVGIYVGIETYRGGGFRDTPGCEKDANTLSQLFERDYGYTTGAKLLTAKATKAAIEAAIRKHALAAGENDVLILFFAMHGQTVDFGNNGGKQGYFIPHDATFDSKSTTRKDWDDGAVSMNRVMEMTRKPACKARHVLIVADTCCSGFLGTRGDLASEPSLRVLLKNPSRRILAATTATQQALGEDKGGIFTEKLIDSLKSKEAQSVLDVFLDVRKAVVAASREKMMPQCEVFDTSEGEFVFLPNTPRLAADVKALVAYVSEEKPKPALLAMVPRGVERMNERVRRRTTLDDVLDAWSAEDYRFGNELRKNEKLWEGRLARHLENARVGQPLAMAALVYYYTRGLGTRKDPDAAYRWAETAFDTGHDCGLHVYGKCMSEGIGCDKSVLAGQNYIDKAFDRDFPISIYVRGWDRFRNGDRDKAIDHWLKAERLGVVTAMIDGCRSDLSGKNPDLAKIVELLGPAVAKDRSEACFLVADCRRRQSRIARIAAAKANGAQKTALTTDSAKCNAESEKLVRKAANLGSAEAQYVLARELLAPRDTMTFDSRRWFKLTSDKVAATRYAEEAVGQKHVLAHVLLASRLIDVDPKRAMALQLFAADAGEPSAWALQAQWYAAGTKTVDIDLARAVTLARKTLDAMPDHAGAHQLLGAIFSDSSDPAVLQKFLKAEDFAQNRPVFRHYALWHALQADASVDYECVAGEILKKHVDEIQKNPNLIYWGFFKRDYPESVFVLNKHMGSNLK